MNENPAPETNESYRINATPDSSSPTGVYIPATFEEAITELDKMLPVVLKLKLLEDFIWDYHFTLGLWLRNNWNLWKHPPLVQNLVEMGASAHPDDLGSLLLRGYQKYLKSPLGYIDWLENLDEAHIKIQERLKLLLNCDRAIVWVRDNSHQHLWTKIFISNKIQEVRMPQSSGLPGKIIESQKTLNIPFDLYDHPGNENMSETDKKIGYRSCNLLGMPIFNTDGNMIGAVLLTNKIKPGQFPPYNPQNWPEAPECWQNSFSDDDEAFLKKLNQQIATVINRFTVEE
ncbi:GAF domain-containing protein [Kamptonema animale CS-326]|jgi:hypothetical protein|uniref:GAF domain-containing protein n=1 Tax=Kamptonema animale TaxID=92934 RepID=UPI00232E668F|nr:GAF domain-containing protein [Kamptonema animale]MDB9513857.1 GAF domain-containing protein [Kamptonema animale CS-326]